MSREIPEFNSKTSPDSSSESARQLLSDAFNTAVVKLAQSTGNETKQESRPVPVPVPPFPRPEPDPWPRDPCEPDPLPWPKPGCPAPKHFDDLKIDLDGDKKK